MLLISHRGNVSGKIEHLENSIDYIKDAIKNGFHVETDVIFFNKSYYFGHCKNSVREKVNLKFLKQNSDKLLIHCKDIQSLFFIRNLNLNYFYHDNESYTISSNQWIISHSENIPKKLEIKNTIVMLPEKFGLSKKNLLKCSGICSDIISFYD